MIHWNNGQCAAIEKVRVPTEGSPRYLCVKERHGIICVVCD